MSQSNLKAPPNPYPEKLLRKLTGQSPEIPVTDVMLEATALIQRQYEESRCIQTILMGADEADIEYKEGDSWNVKMLKDLIRLHMREDEERYFNIYYTGMIKGVRHSCISGFELKTYPNHAETVNRLKEINRKEPIISQIDEISKLDYEAFWSCS